MGPQGWEKMFRVGQISGSALFPRKTPLSRRSSSFRFRVCAKFVTQNDPGVARFKRWAVETGIKFPKLELADFDGLRGLAALTEIKIDDELVSLPRGAAIELEPKRRSPEFCEKDAWASCPWFVKLALLLVKEKKLGEESKFSEYVKSLPKKVDVPVNWGEEELSQFQYRPIINRVGLQKAALVERYSSIASAITFDLSKEDFSWALSCVRSRSFSGPYIGSRLSDRIRGGVLVATLAVANITVLGGSVEQTLNALIAVTIFNLLYEFLLSRDLSVYVLAPAVDLINHSCYVETDLSYDYFQDSYAVRAAEDYSRGEQVFISYGKQSNDSLMQYYGFCIADNPDDAFVIEDLRTGVSEILDVGTSSYDGLDASDVFENVKVTRDGFPAKTLNALRKVISTSQGEGDSETRLAELLKKICERELDRMGTSLTSDEAEVARKRNAREEWALKFRIEKKKILRDCVLKIGG
ncbi:hypothetical protein BSKO_10715 [Bryopsis sp. KO-2023]|nr:hypothetical protein BSKO_10715 [Bryopsis sp. KO-2023]